MNNAESPLARDIAAATRIVTSQDIEAVAEWRNAARSYREDLAALEQGLTPEQREALRYVLDREIAFALKSVIDAVRAKPTIFA